MDLTEFDRLFDKKNYKRHPWEISRKKVLFKLLSASEIKFPIKNWQMNILQLIPHIHPKS